MSMIPRRGTSERRGRRAIRLGAGALAAVVATAPAGATSVDVAGPPAPPGDEVGARVPREGRPDTHLETPGDLPAPAGDRITSPAFRGVRNGFLSVQVNVDANGNNIVGDAANEPTIAVDPNNSLRAVIGWRQFDTIASNFRQAGWGFTRDGGRTWTFPGVIEPGIFRSDPVLDVDVDGRFYYNSLTLDGGDFLCNVFVSEDGGASWGPGVFAFGGDKQWMAIDRSDGIGRGNIYANWTSFFSVCEPGQFTRSYDQGDSYLDCLEVPQRPQWGTMAVGSDGAVYVGGTNFGSFLVVKSSTLQDQELPVQFDFVASVDLSGQIIFGGGPNPGGLLGQAWVAVDASGGDTHGNVYFLASVDPPGIDPLDVMFARSTDGGRTWSAPVRVNDDPTNNRAWQWFGTMSVAPNGRIDVVWNDTRNDPGGVDSELFYSFSEDGGLSWSENIAASPAFDPHIGWPQQNKIGDYSGMISDRVGADVAYAATFNGEQDVYYLRLGGEDCNGNGVDDADDIAKGGSSDFNGNGIPDECECLTDVDGSGEVDFEDLLALLAAWGPCDGCPEDINRDGTVSFSDILLVLSSWGPCA